MTVEAKRAAVVEAAYGVFLRYGFRRTTMDDIATSAGMSRPALYLLFKNKEDIFRAGALSLCNRCLAEAQTDVDRKLNKPDLLLSILNHALFNVLEELAASPHGEELLGLEEEIAADIDSYWQTNICRVLAEAIGGDNKVLHAKLVLDAVKGMKQRNAPVPEIRTSIMALLKLL